MGVRNCISIEQLLSVTHAIYYCFIVLLYNFVHQTLVSMGIDFEIEQKNIDSLKY